MLLITPIEIISLAFSKREIMNPENIRYSSIDIAQERYIASRLGYELYDRLIGDEFYDFTERYIKPALSYYVRYMLIDDLVVHVDDRGCLNFTGKDSSSSKKGDNTAQEISTKSDSSVSTISEYNAVSPPNTKTIHEEITAQKNATDTKTMDSSSSVTGRTDTYATASNSQIHKLQVRTLADANTLMAKAIRHIENNEQIFGKFKGSARHYF